MVKSVLALFESFCFSLIDFLLFLAICFFLLFLGLIFWPVLKWGLLGAVIWIVLFFTYQMLKLWIEYKRVEQDDAEKVRQWARQELQRPIIQRTLQKQEQNKPFITGTITHVSDDGKETKLGNITINLKDK